MSSSKCCLKNYSKLFFHYIYQKRKEEKRKVKYFLFICRDFAEKNSQIPWASLYVHGDPNSLVSFGGVEHSFTTTGDNSYAIFVSSGAKCLYYEFLSSNKALK